MPIQIKPNESKCDFYAKEYIRSSPKKDTSGLDTVKKLLNIIGALLILVGILQGIATNALLPEFNFSVFLIALLTYGAASIVVFGAASAINALQGILDSSYDAAMHTYVTAKLQEESMKNNP